MRTMSSTWSSVRPVCVRVRACDVQVDSKVALVSAAAGVVLLKTCIPVGDCPDDRAASVEPGAAALVFTVKVGEPPAGAPATRSMLVVTETIVIFICLLRMTNGKCWGRRVIVAGEVLLARSRWKTSGNSLLRLNARTRPMLLLGFEMAANMLLSCLVMFVVAAVLRTSPPSRAV